MIICNEMGDTIASVQPFEHPLLQVSDRMEEIGDDIRV